MTTALAESFLPKLCAPDDDRRSERFGSPFHAYAHGQYWTVATDGRHLVALAGLAPGFTVNTGVVRAVTPYLQPIRHDDCAPFELLRQWVGEAVWEEPCPQCKGKPFDLENPNETYCDYCDSDGKIYPEPCTGRLLRSIIDRRRLARCLEHLTPAAVQIGYVPFKVNMSKHEPLGLYPQWSDVPLVFEVPGLWRVVLMPMSSDGDSVRKQGAGATFGADLVRPEWLSWHGGTVRKLAEMISREQRWGDAVILADALEESGCDDAVVLDHCRRRAENVQSAGRWVIEAILAAGG